MFLYPTFPSIAFNKFWLVSKLIGVQYCMMFNVMGLPSTHIPLGIGKDGLPVGLQVRRPKHYFKKIVQIPKTLII